MNKTTNEPVAWLWVVDGKNHNVKFGGANSNTPKDWTVLPLYTHPPVPYVTESRTAQPAVAAQHEHSAPHGDPNGLATYVIGCFQAAEVEGLQEALAETEDERLKDLVERRLMHALYAAQNTTSLQPKEPEHSAPHGEPVAWMDIDEKGAASGLRYWSEPDNRHEVALYTTPPTQCSQRPSRSDIKPLTDEQMNKVLDEVGLLSPYAVARAIEAAHGIKE